MTFENCESEWVACPEDDCEQCDNERRRGDEFYDRYIYTLRDNGHLTDRISDLEEELDGLLAREKIVIKTIGILTWLCLTYYTIYSGFKYGWW